LSPGYREKLIAALLEPENGPQNGTGRVNKSVKVTFFTISRCFGGGLNYVIRSNDAFELRALNVILLR
jgi:hypothetical protein